MSLASLRRLIAVLLTCAPAALAAQQIRGTVLLADSITPAPGVLIHVLDSTGQVLTRTLTTSIGTFAVPVGAPGRYSVRVLRIGFLPVEVPPVQVGAAQTEHVRIALRSLPVALPGVGVRGERGECRGPLDSAQAVFRVWNEAGKALASAELAAQTGALTLEWTSWRRTIMRDDSTVREDLAIRQRGRTPRPFRSASAEDLAKYGYRREINGDDIYLAPDAQVLLSPTFLGGHCFSVHAPSAAHPDWVGAEFRPMRDRAAVVDIAGTAWIDRTSAELRLLEFRYTGLPRELDDAGAAGRLEYVRLSSGEFVIARWQVKLPGISVESRDISSFDGATRTQRSITVTRTATTGGELERARSEGTERYAVGNRTVPFRLAGETTDLDVAQATLAFGGDGGPVVLTDSVGVAGVVGLRAGAHVVGITTAPMRELVATPIVRRVTVGAAGAPAATMLTVSDDDIVAAACGERERRGGDALVFGVVRNQYGDPSVGDSIEVRWDKGLRAELAFPNEAGNWNGIRVVTDEAGRWKACGVTRPSMVMILQKRAQAIIELGRVKVVPEARVVRLPITVTR